MNQKTIIQISSGSGPVECELAVAKLLGALQVEFPGLEITQTVPGQRPGCFRSVQVTGEYDFTFLEGSIQWICPSPFRPGHRRKNWFVDVSLCLTARMSNFDPEDVRFETFRSGGKGGQHVNKVESGVRAIHSPSGLTAVSTSKRSQHANKKLALERLRAQLTGKNQGQIAAAPAKNWLEHHRIQSGNPVRVCRGLGFVRV
jgi:putative peptide chain release factor H